MDSLTCRASGCFSYGTVLLLRPPMIDLLHGFVLSEPVNNQLSVSLFMTLYGRAITSLVSRDGDDSHLHSLTE